MGQKIKNAQNIGDFSDYVASIENLSIYELAGSLKFARRDEYARKDSNLQPSVPKTDALSNCATDAFLAYHVIIRNKPVWLKGEGHGKILPSLRRFQACFLYEKPLDCSPQAAIPSIHRSHQSV